MKFWILLVIAGVLLLWSFVRERFEPTASIKEPPYDSDEINRIFTMLRSDYQTILIDKAKQDTPNETDEQKLKETGGQILIPIIEEFYNAVYKPASVPITESAIDTFLDSKPSSDMRMIQKEALTKYFIDQSGVGTSARTGYADRLAELGQNAGYLRGGSSNPEPVCPTGSVLDSENRCVSSTVVPFTCPEGYDISGTTCVRTGGTETTSPICPNDMTYSIELNACQVENIPPSCPGGYEYTNGSCIPKSATSGTSTGGTSTTSFGPNSGTPTGRNRQVFGPVFTSMGAPINGDGRDTTKTNIYPELVGGMPSTSKGADTTLPNSTSLGSGANARFFPFSRQPGDMDIIPDPYRLSRSFSQASYSSKTEPVPFLTDFSAFLK
jgi:hypothetical protein